MTEVMSKDLILRLEVLDDTLVSSVYESGDGEQEELERVHDAPDDAGAGETWPILNNLDRDVRWCSGSILDGTPRARSRRSSASVAV
jgi:hypothetical protein